MPDKLRAHAELTIKMIRALEDRKSKHGQKLNPWQKKLLKSAEYALVPEVSQTSLVNEQV